MFPQIELVYFDWISFRDCYADRCRGSIPIAAYIGSQDRGQGFYLQGEYSFVLHPHSGRVGERNFDSDFWEHLNSFSHAVRYGVIDHLLLPLRVRREAKRIFPAEVIQREYSEEKVMLSHKSLAGRPLTQ